MFEYLMPLVFTQPFENSLLARACQEALTAQIAYGEEVGLPWGVSECAYSALDANQTYQYRAFGVPDLALNPIADPGPDCICLVASERPSRFHGLIARLLQPLHGL